MAIFLYLAILPLLLFFMYYKSKECKNQHSSCLSLFHTHNLPKHYSLNRLVAIGEENHLSNMSKILAATPSSTVVFHIPLGGGCYIVTANPDNVRHVLKNQFGSYDKGHAYTSIYGDLLGRGIFSTDGDEWRFQRQFASHEFTKGSMRSALEMVVEPCISNCLIPTLSSASKNGRVFDLEDVLQRFTLDTTCKMNFGYDPSCLSESIAGSEFINAFRECFVMVSQRSKVVCPGVKSWQVAKFLNFGSEKRLKEVVCKIRGSVLAIVENKQEKIKQGLEAEDFLSRILRKYNDPEDKDMVIDFIINIILAGHDTISSALTWFLWVVSMNPKVEDEIVREITRIKECNRGSLYDQVKDMVYTHAALYESMRLYPPVAEDMKMAVQDDVWPDGTQVRKGMRVVYSIYSMGRSERIWGEDWAEYKPERWLEKEASSKAWRFVSRDPYAYPVFNAGPRICLGMELAYLQIKLLVARFLIKFKVVPCNEMEPKFLFNMTSKMKGGFPVSLEERKFL